MQMTAGSPKRMGQAKAGAAVGRLPQTRRKRSGPPPSPGLVRGFRRDGRRSPRLGNADGQASVPSRDSLVHKRRLTPKSWGLTGQRSGAAANAGHSGAGDRKGVGTRKKWRESRDGHTGPTGLAPGLTLAWWTWPRRVWSPRRSAPAGNLGRSRPASLPPFSARQGGRDATGFKTEGEDPGEEGERLRKAKAWTQEVATAASSPGLSVPSHARERSGRGGGDGRGEGRGDWGKERRAAPSSHRATGPLALAHVGVISASSVLTPTAQS